MKGAEAIFAAASRAELDRRYAEELSGAAGEDPWRSGLARAAFRARRGLLGEGAEREAGPLPTRQEWLAAWFDPAVPEEPLREAMPAAGPAPASREELDAFLAIRPQWLSVRTDPAVPAALLDSYRERCLHPDRPTPGLDAIPGARQAAFRIRALYPGLFAADAGVLGALLSPDLAEWPAPPPRRRQPRRERSNAWILIAVVFGLMAASRACDRDSRSRPAGRGSGTRTETIPAEEWLRRIGPAGRPVDAPAPSEELREILDRSRRFSERYSGTPEAQAERERLERLLRERIGLPDRRAPPEDPDDR